MEVAVTTAAAYDASKLISQPQNEPSAAQPQNMIVLVISEDMDSTSGTDGDNRMGCYAG